MAGGGAVTTGKLGRSDQYTGGFTVYVFIVCLVAASGGLLFGYDIGVTGGVTGMIDFQEKFFPEVVGKSTDSPYCKFDDQRLQAFTSSLFIAGAFSSLVASVITTRYGRKITMLVGGLFFCLGAGLTAGAVNLAMLVIGRVCLGFGVGFANQSVPLYLSEIAPYNFRGALNMLFQMATTIGILAAQLINYGTQNIHPWGWRLSLALAGVPAIALTFGALVLPETPNSLIERGLLDRGRKVLQRVRGVQDVDIEFDDIKVASDIAAQVKHPWRSIFTRRYRPQLVIAVLIPAFQQLTGINSIMFYAPQIFESIGSGDALLQTLIIGAVNVLATLVAIFTCDRGGRKVLFTIGGIQMGIAEVVTGIILGTQFSSSNELGDGAAIVTLVFVCIFVAGFAWSWGPLGWLVPNEIQPLETRSAGQSIATTVNFLLSFIIGQAFLSMLCAMEFGTFLFFAGWVLVMTLFVWFFLPETKRVPIEEMDLAFGTHWFWKRIVPLDKVSRMSADPYTDGKPTAAGKPGVEMAAYPQQQYGDNV